jgi:hypothetical protein
MRTYPLLVLALGLVTLWLSAKIGASFRKRRRNAEETEREDFSIVVAGTMTLLALIIGFSFSMASSRYDQRKNLEESEANAIGTEYVRADFLPASDAARVRTLLRSYLDQRIIFYETRNDSMLRQNDAATAVVRRAGPGCGSANTSHHRCCHGHERCIELARIHTSCLVEPHPDCGLGTDDSNGHLLHPANRIWRATW